jgi:hypothetical protein
MPPTTRHALVDTRDEPDAPNPIAALEDRLERSTIPNVLRAASDVAAHPEPLRSVYETIERARRALEADEALEVRAEPSEEAPLEWLEALLEAEQEEVGRRETVELVPTSSQRATPAESPDHTTRSSNPRSGSPDTEAARVGRAVLETLADEPLSGRRRVEALQRLSNELEDPDPDAIRDVFRLLLKD